MTTKLIHDLRGAETMPYKDDEAFRWYADITNKAADRIEELEAINEKMMNWVEKRKEDLTAAYRTIDYLRAELERQKKAREGLTPAEALADYFKRNSKAIEEHVERNNAVLKRLREDTE